MRLRDCLAANAKKTKKTRRLSSALRAGLTQKYSLTLPIWEDERSVYGGF